MKYNYLGNTGIQVSFLCMGTMTFGREADKVESRAMFNCCRDAGVNFFDCANVYSQGAAETILGELIADCRHELVVTSKFGSPIGSGPNTDGGSRRHLAASLEASLKRLNTDFLDIYFLHRFDELTPLEETPDPLRTNVSDDQLLEFVGDWPYPPPITGEATMATIRVTLGDGHLVAHLPFRGTFNVYLQPDGTFHMEDSHQRFEAVRNADGSLAGLVEVGMADGGEK